MASSKLYMISLYYFVTTCSKIETWQEKTLICSSVNDTKGWPHYYINLLPEESLEFTFSIYNVWCQPAVNWMNVVWWKGMNVPMTEWGSARGHERKERSGGLVADTHSRRRWDRWRKNPRKQLPARAESSCRNAATVPKKSWPFSSQLLPPSRSHNLNGAQEQQTNRTDNESPRPPNIAVHLMFLAACACVAYIACRLHSTTQPTPKSIVSHLQPQKFISSSPKAPQVLSLHSSNISPGVRPQPVHHSLYRILK